MSVRLKLRELVNRLRSYGRDVRESRDDLADSVSSENVLTPIPPETRPDPRHRRSP